MVMGLVEDKRIFSNLSFIKIRLRNRLGEHLDLMVRMFSQHFFIGGFSVSGFDHTLA